ncbi:hypothetical protein TRVA0_025S01992 [Trichomonascus vanleenenianus]|uniref:Mzm1p n=1 Tax=Trichomonascus vanleenenianus TaxID=2268995 RepID=UPI003ECB380F
MHAAHLKIRDEYKANAAQTFSKEELDEKLQYAHDVALILRRNIVQGAKDKTSENDRYVLNIHSETELGDNESIKKNRKNTSGKRNTLTGELVDESVPGVGN